MVNIFEHTSSVSYMVELLQNKTRLNTSFSLRAWSLKLDYKSPSYLSQVIRKDRTVGRDLIDRIIKSEDLCFIQTKYLIILFYRDFLGDEGYILDDLMAQTRLKMLG
jgi:hypothetical protein